MAAKVALVEFNENVQESFNHALELIGGLDDLNRAGRSVVVKVGVFDPKSAHHSSVDVVSAIVNGFSRAPRIYLSESDNYRGTGSERLQIWKKLFSERVVPFNLSEDEDTKVVKATDEKMGLSHILFKPNVFVSTHVLRVYERGSILKNLFGLVPDKKKVKYHKKLDTLLCDIFEAIGGIDLAVLDGTYLLSSVAPSAKSKRLNLLAVGRDAVAVEAVGAAIVGMDAERMPILQEAMRRGLGEGNLDKIEVLGSSIESIRKKFGLELKAKKKKLRKPNIGSGMKRGLYQ